MFSDFVRSEYCSAVANNVYEAKKLIEAGFEYVAIMKQCYSEKENRLALRALERNPYLFIDLIQNQTKIRLTRTAFCIDSQ